MFIKVITLNEAEEWLDIVKSFKESDVYFHPEYCRAFQENGDGEPMVFYLEDDCGRVANVFLKRDLHLDKRFKDLVPAGEFYDITTVYGYGGPLYEATDFEKLKQCFDREFKAFCNENSIVSDFVRFHCIFGNQRLMEGNYDIESVRTTIYFDLTEGEKHIWDNLESGCRNNIKRAQKYGVTVEIGRDSRLLENFKELYKQTMDRDNASSYYYFNESFFETTMEGLKNNSLIFAADYEDRIVAAAIVIFGDGFAHFHFGASDRSYSNLRPNNLLMYEIAIWAQRQGKKMFHLGGGAAGSDDSLFRFKKTFSKTNRLPFFIGRKVYNEAAYSALVKLRIENDKGFNSASTFFPKYRG